MSETKTVKLTIPQLKAAGRIFYENSAGCQPSKRVLQELAACLQDSDTRPPDALAGQLYEALKDVMNGNDLALERNHSIENWRNSDFRKKATAALRAYQERAK